MIDIEDEYFGPLFMIGWGLLVVIVFMCWSVTASIGQSMGYLPTPTPCVREEFLAEVLKVFNEPRSEDYYISTTQGEVIEVGLEQFMVLQPGDAIQVKKPGCGFIYHEVVKEENDGTDSFRE